MLVPLCHFGENLWGEDPSHSRQAHQNRRLHIIDHFRKTLVLLAVIIIAREEHFMVCQFISSIVGDQALCVNEPEAASCILWGQTFSLEELDDLLGHANPSTAGTKEDGSMIFDWDTGPLDRANHTSQYNGSGALDVIIEASEISPISFKCWEGVFEILELDDDAKTCKQHFRQDCLGELKESFQPPSEAYWLQYSGREAPPEGMTCLEISSTTPLYDLQTYPRNFSVMADMSSSKNSCSSSAETFSLLLPMYNGSSLKALLFVPRSRVIGRAASGLIPAQAT